MKFSVEIRRIRTDFARFEVEADSYQEADTKAMELARKADMDVFRPRYVPTEFRPSSTDHVDMKCDWCKKPIKGQPEVVITPQRPGLRTLNYCSRKCENDADD